MLGRLDLGSSHVPRSRAGLDRVVSYLNKRDNTGDW
jgi:hypothetical protein